MHRHLSVAERGSRVSVRRAALSVALSAALAVALAALVIPGLFPSGEARAATPAAVPAQVPAAATPLQHLIIVIGENQSFDALFATYTPRAAGETVRNLRSEAIVQPDGSPGPRFSDAVQQRAVPQSVYRIDPPRAGPYAVLPRPRLIGVTDEKFRDVGTGPDPRFPANLPPGPFPITRHVPYPRDGAPVSFQSSTSRLSAATGDPVHRFFQMWQQTGGDNAKRDLYTWVAVTTGMGADTAGVTAADPGQGGEVMGFVNMQAGDAAYLRGLADQYAISDNYHQSIMGGTGANFFALVTGDLPVYRIDGRLATPPANQIENPDPAPGTDNFYRGDGYQGGSYVNCSDPKQPGVAQILGVLARKGVPSRCEPGAWYLVNNYGTGYDLDGHPQPLGPHNYVYPPQTVPTIAEALSRHGVAWKWYIGARDAADLTQEQARLRLSLEAARRAQYNDTGDPLVASTAVMTDPQLKARLVGLDTFRRDLAQGTLPAVSFLVPKNRDSGHPGYSVVASYESFLKEVVTQVQASRAVWAHAAILATTDEGGGSFDSGYIQVLDFFGDGPRVPLIAISPYARRGHVDHVYADHASLLKLIERNWRLPPLSPRSRDRFPDPVTAPGDPYRPVNSPALGDLMTLFNFQQ